MSAYTVDKDVIDLIVSAALVLSPADIAAQIDTDHCGFDLWSENYASVNFRYTESETAPEYKFEQVAEIARGQQLTGGHLVQILKCIENYRYQSCEHPGWPESAAYLLCQALEQSIEVMLILWPKTELTYMGGPMTYAGMGSATWGFHREDGFTNVLERTRGINVRVPSTIEDVFPVGKLGKDDEARALTLAMEVQSAIMRVKGSINNGLPIDPNDFTVARTAIDELEALVQLTQ